MATNNVPNVWTQMNYVPPRGQCNFKQSIVSSKCPCLRFMLHPLKSSSSYECDGCSHHASFHSMENKTEDEIRKRWEQEAREKQEQEDQLASRPRKRLRELEYNGSIGSSQGRPIANGMLTPDDLEMHFQSAPSEAGVSRPKMKKKGAQPTMRGTRSRGKVVEIPEDDADYVELD